MGVEKEPIKYCIGVDISHHQNYIVDADFVIHKATEGISFVDKNFVARAQRLSKDIILGAYHFCHPESNGALPEAQHFCKVYKQGARQMFVALDVEAKALGVEPRTLDNWCTEWCMYVHDTLGVAPFVYISDAYVKLIPNTLTLFPLWVARYSLSAEPKNTNWLMWQCTSNPLDIDLYKGDKESLSKWAIPFVR